MGFQGIKSKRLISGEEIIQNLKKKMGKIEI